MAGVLEVAQPVQDDDVAEVDVGAVGSMPELHPQRTALAVGRGRAASSAPAGRQSTALRASAAASRGSVEPAGSAIRANARLSRPGGAARVARAARSQRSPGSGALHAVDARERRAHTPARRATDPLRPAHRDAAGRLRRRPRAPADRPRVNKLRLALILVGLGMLAAVSTVFGMMMAVAQDLPVAGEPPEYKRSQNSVAVRRQRQARSAS